MRIAKQSVSFILLLAALLVRGGEPSRPPATNYFIVVTGGELLEGVYPDAHTSFITRSLLPLGLRCIGSIIVDDDRDDILDALAYATNKTSLIIVTGGLGPTPNDITRETLSEFTKIEIRENPVLIEQMEKRFNTPREKLRENLVKQTKVPVTGGYLKNSIGTASGLIFEAQGFEIIALPGPPRELRQMVNEELIPYLIKKYGIRPAKHVATVRFIGIGQSQIDDTLKKIIKIPPDIIVTSLFEAGRVDFFFLHKEDTAENRKRIETVVRKLVEHFGDSVYSTDHHSLEDVVAINLESKKYEVMVADACYGFFLQKIQESEHFRNILASGVSAPSCDRIASHLKIDSPQWNKLENTSAKVEIIADKLRSQGKKTLAICIGEPLKTRNGFSIPVIWKTNDGDRDAFDVSIYDLSSASMLNLTTQILDRIRRKLK